MEGTESDEEAAHGPKGEVASEDDRTRVSMLAAADKALEAVKPMDTEPATAAAPSTSCGINNEPVGSLPAAVTTAATGAHCLLCLI